LGRFEYIAHRYLPRFTTVSGVLVASGRESESDTSLGYASDRRRHFLRRQPQADANVVYDGSGNLIEFREIAQVLKTFEQQNRCEEVLVAADE